MIFQENATLQQKLAILADGAKYDVACTSSGVSRGGKQGYTGNSEASGICHSFAADGRCISLLKILYTNECIYNCKYCINRCTNDVPRATFTPEEVCTLTMEFYRRNYIEGLFLSSGIIESPDYTMELICKTLQDLRRIHRFHGYIHCKAIPGASPELVEAAGWYADRMSVNLELPTARGLQELAPNKSRGTILTPMRQIQNGMAESREQLGMKGGNQSAYWYTQKRMGRELPGSQTRSSERGITQKSRTSSNLSGQLGSDGLLLPGKTGSHSCGQPFASGSDSQGQFAISGHPATEGQEASSLRNHAEMDCSGQSGKVQNEKTSIHQTADGNRENKEADSAGLQTFSNSAGSGLTQWKQQDTSRGFVPAGQSTQMIIGATAESDYEIMAVSEALYQRFDLKRVFYSAFINVNQDSTLPALEQGPPLRREHRLYQADFLLRYYGFRADELLSEKRPFFNTYLDPKCDWALGHLEQFPVEINTADFDTLLRVPGIGTKSAHRIVAARRSGSLDYQALKAIGVVLKRAVYFITCNGHMLFPFLKIEEDYITRKLLENDADVMKGYGDKVTYKQLTLFEDFGVMQNG
ncbi:MAG: putative DNA modification/repair radical SAM protein [Lachnospiraceae bacterium]|nr:putative DNA modification/repair radical SAM protein [Lachnospiraceae bacterium]